MSGSTVHAAITGLTSTCRTALAATSFGIEVQDGPLYDPNRSYLAVGWHSNDEPAATVERSIADARRARDEESYDIACLLSMWVGNKTIAQVRGDLHTAFEAVMAAIDADPKLNDSVSRARIHDYAYLPAIAEGGVQLSIRFNVNVIAWK